MECTPERRPYRDEATHWFCCFVVRVARNPIHICIAGIEVSHWKFIHGILVHLRTPNPGHIVHSLLTKLVHNVPEVGDKLCLFSGEIVIVRRCKAAVAPCCCRIGEKIVELPREPDKYPGL